ncbi:MAG: sugar ABC transporter permease [Nitrospiraceae bacterium]|nr:sugar ABC transporter permease [Nitrospiraceae bacterium]
MTPAIQADRISDRTRRASTVGKLALPYTFFLPAFLLVAAVSFLPVFFAIQQSFYKAKYLELGIFVGFENYVQFFTENDGLDIVGHSVVFVVGSLALAMPLGVGLAIILNLRFPFRDFFRVVLIMPWLVSSLVTAMLWAWLLNGDFGPIGDLLRRFGIDMPTAVTSVKFAMPALIMANAWHWYPLVMVFVLAALQTIPEDLHESAMVDGASAWQRFWLVTFPLIKNTILVTLVLSTLHTFNNATIIFVMTGGGPVDVTKTLAVDVFLEGFKFYRMGLASAVAIMCFVFNVVFTLLYIRVLRAEHA